MAPRYPGERWLHEPTFCKDHLHPEDRDWAVELCQMAVANDEATLRAAIRDVLANVMFAVEMKPPG
jgi:hypothetical protein